MNYTPTRMSMHISLLVFFSLFLCNAIKYKNERRLKSSWLINMANREEWSISSECIGDICVELWVYSVFGPVQGHAYTGIVTIDKAWI